MHLKCMIWFLNSKILLRLRPRHKIIITGALKQVVSPKIGTLVLKTITDRQFGLATGGLVSKPSDPKCTIVRIKEVSWRAWFHVDGD